MNSAGGSTDLLDGSFLIRRSTDRRLLTAPRGLSQFCHVLHRLLVPRHPPNALESLTTRTVALRIRSLERARCAPADGQVAFCLHSASLFASIPIAHDYLFGLHAKKHDRGNTAS